MSTSPRPRPFRAAVASIALALLATPATRSQDLGAVTGSDWVVLGRLHQKAGTVTDALARFGVVAGGSPRSVDVPATAEGGTGGFRAVFSARRRGAGVELTWELVPSGGAVQAATGSIVVEPGTLGHVPMGSGAGTSVFASVEAGRASSFAHDRLQRAFTWAPGAAAPPVTSAAAAPAASRATSSAPAPAPAPVAPAGAEPSGILACTFRVEQDGQVVFAPRVRVVSGQSFRVSGGATLTLKRSGSASTFDGLEIAGTARRAEDAAWLDLSVQSGRAIEAAEPATYVVDRYRHAVRAPLGQDVALSLFGDLPGVEAGRLDLSIRCDAE